MAPWSLVAPASRGIGFALARHLLRTTKAPVVATARDNLETLKHELVEGLDVDKTRLEVLKLDFLDESTIIDTSNHCAAKFNGKDQHHLRLAFVVPGVLFPEKSPRQLDVEHAILAFRTNTIGPMLMLKHFSQFLPNKNVNLGSDGDAPGSLPSAAIMAFMSARVGSISDNKLGGWYSYRASKAALNQVVKTFDNHLRTAAGVNAISIALHPGTVKTGLSREFWANVKKEKLFEPEWVAERPFKVVKDVSAPYNIESGRGKCWGWDGKEIPP